MPRFNPFGPVDCRYGAPMGRPRIDVAPSHLADAPTLYARKQGGGDGYDQGGAYWGLPSNVWAVWTRGGEAACYVRAQSRADAIAQARAL